MNIYYHSFGDVTAISWLELTWPSIISPMPNLNSYRNTEEKRQNSHISNIPREDIFLWSDGRYMSQCQGLDLYSTQADARFIRVKIVLFPSSVLLWLAPHRFSDPGNSRWLPDFLIFCWFVPLFLPFFFLSFFLSFCLSSFIFFLSLFLFLIT